MPQLDRNTQSGSFSRVSVSRVSLTFPSENVELIRDEKHSSSFKAEIGVVRSLWTGTCQLGNCVSLKGKLYK